MISLDELCKASPQTIVVTSVGTLRDAFALWNEEQLAKKKQEEDTTLLDETTVQHLLHKSRPTREHRLQHAKALRSKGKIFFGSDQYDKVSDTLVDLALDKEDVDAFAKVRKAMKS